MDAELAIEFIAKFSRMEYALKSTDYAKGNDHVTAAWRRFAVDINNELLAIKDEDFLQAKDFLMASPPKRQIRENGLLKFVDIEINPKNLPAQNLMEYLSTIRNNLFHGGKYMPNGEQEASRNENLVKAALTILNYSYPIKENVKTSFEV